MLERINKDRVNFSRGSPILTDSHNFFHAYTNAALEYYYYYVIHQLRHEQD